MLTAHKLGTLPQWRADEFLFQLLIEAVSNRHLSTTRFLLEQGASLHAGDNLVLESAKDQEVLALLIGWCLKHHEKQHQHDIFPWIVATNNVSLASSLLIETDPDNEDGVHYKKDKALEKAATCGHMEMTKLLIDHKADTNKSYGLLGAARNGHLSIVTLLLANRANVGSTMGDATLVAAAKRGDLAIVSLLLDRKANLTGTRGEALTAAVAHAHQPVVELLLKQKHCHLYTWEALREAVRRGHLRMVQLLLRQRPSALQSGDSPLQVAIERGHTNLIELLLDHGASPHKPYLNFALDTGVKEGRVDVVQLLISRRAVKDLHKSYVALSTAVGLNRVTIAALLIEHKADVRGDYCSRPQTRPLYVAASHGRTELVDLFLRDGVDLQAQGHDALLLAVKNGHLETAALLIDKGALVVAETLDCARKLQNEEMLQLLTNEKS